MPSSVRSLVAAANQGGGDQGSWNKTSPPPRISFPPPPPLTWSGEQMTDPYLTLGYLSLQTLWSSSKVGTLQRHNKEGLVL